MKAAMRNDTRGLTLIELVVALAVFALIAVMGLQALTGTLRMRDALLARDAEAADLARATALLRQDLAAMAPLLFFPPDGPPRSAIQADPDRLALSLAGQPALGDPHAGLRQRAVWQRRPGSGQLTRQVWPGLAPSGLAQAGPEVVLLADVTALRVRSFWPGLGWQEGADNLTLSDAPDSGPGVDEDGARTEIASRLADTLPEAVEVTLEIAGFGPVVLVESLK